jgi:hypothetical protein
VIDRGAGLRVAVSLVGLLSLSGLIVSAIAAPSVDVAVKRPVAAGKTIGLVLTDWRYALYQTPGLEECPNGLQRGSVEQFRALDDPAGHFKKFGGTFETRGANGENANYSPLLVNDALPFSELKTKIGYGFNLDGTVDGHATPKTLAHEKFTSPEGEPVDNQMARVLGCVQGWRKAGFMAEFYSKEVETSPINRHLIEISSVDDENNDANVVVTIYKGRDRLVRAPSGEFIPYLSHRVDERFPQFVYRTHGRIIDGVLSTDPIPLARLPLVQIQMIGERRIRDLTLRLKLTRDGAQGMLGGYEEIASWWNMHSKSPGSDVGKYSPAELYRALYRYGDGYPDPTTGQPTAISVTYQVSAVRAMIVHTNPPSAGGIVAQVGTSR